MSVRYRRNKRKQHVVGAAGKLAVQRDYKLAENAQRALLARVVASDEANLSSIAEVGKIYVKTGTSSTYKVHTKHPGGVITLESTLNLKTHDVTMLRFAAEYTLAPAPAQVPPWRPTLLGRRSFP